MKSNDNLLCENSDNANIPEVPIPESEQDLQKQLPNLSVADGKKTFEYRFAEDSGGCRGSSSSLEMCYLKSSESSVDEELLMVFLIKDGRRGVVRSNKQIMDYDFCTNKSQNSTTVACCGSIQYEEIEIEEGHSGFGVTFMSDAIRPLRFNGTNHSGVRYEYNNSMLNNRSKGIRGQLLLFTLNIGEVC